MKLYEHLLFPPSLCDEIEKMINSFWWSCAKRDDRGIQWMAWDKLTVCKKFGGMGFRNIYAFNLEMLGKQGWKILSSPDTMISKLFKARYFPKGDFTDAEIGHNPSYCWRSICSLKVLLRQGYRWRIGDGAHINAWIEPWLRKEGHHRITSTMNPDISQLNVQHLMIPGEKRWDLELIKSTFNEQDVEAILDTPLFTSVNEDR